MIRTDSNEETRRVFSRNCELGKLTNGGGGSPSWLESRSMTSAHLSTNSCGANPRELVGPSYRANFFAPLSSRSNNTSISISRVSRVSCSTRSRHNVQDTTFAVGGDGMMFRGQFNTPIASTRDSVISTRGEARSHRNSRRRTNAEYKNIPR